MEVAKSARSVRRGTGGSNPGKAKGSPRRAAAKTPGQTRSHRVPRGARKARGVALATARPAATGVAIPGLIGARRGRSRLMAAKATVPKKMNPNVGRVRSQRSKTRSMQERRAKPPRKRRKKKLGDPMTVECR